MTLRQAMLVLSLSLLPVAAIAQPSFSSDFSDDFDKVGVYLQTATFASALKAANQYASLPRCSAEHKPPCSKQATVNKIIVAANEANAAITNAQQFALNGADNATREQSVKVANKAITDLVKLIQAQ